MNILLILKGIIIGIGKIIPGVSGSVMAISFNIYDKAIYSITNFFDNPKKSLKFLFNLGLGVVIGIILFSKVINYFITNYYFYTSIFFIGLIVGGIREIYKNTSTKLKGIILTTISFILMNLISILSVNNTYIEKNNIIDCLVYFISGILEGIGTIIPGISSTALLMMIGIYKTFINSISNITNINFIIHNLKFLSSFTIGFILSIIICLILINIALKKYKKETFSIILGIFLSNILFLIINLIPYVTITNIFLGIQLLILGIMLSLLF